MSGLPRPRPGPTPAGVLFVNRIGRLRRRRHFLFGSVVATSGAVSTLGSRRDLRVYRYYGRRRRSNGHGDYRIGKDRLQAKDFQTTSGGTREHQ